MPDACFIFSFVSLQKCLVWERNLEVKKKALYHLFTGMDIFGIEISKEYES